MQYVCHVCATRGLLPATARNGAPFPCARCGARLVLLSRVSGGGETYSTRTASDAAPGEPPVPIAVSRRAKRAGKKRSLPSPTQAPPLRVRKRRMKRRAAPEPKSKLAQPGKKVKLPKGKPSSTVTEPSFDPTRSFAGGVEIADAEQVYAEPTSRPMRRKLDGATLRLLGATLALLAAVAGVAVLSGDAPPGVEVHHSGLVSSDSVVVIGEAVLAGKPDGGALRLVVRVRDGTVARSRTVDISADEFVPREEDGRYARRFRVDFSGLGLDGYEITYGWVDGR